MTEGSSLVLVGMPASGKSTIGVLAAKVLGLDFLDTDILLQQQTGLKLHQLLEREGTSVFLSAEDRLLSQLTPERALISTGGSAVYHKAGMGNLKRRGLVVWLDVPFSEVERRLGDMARRGVVLGPGQTLRNLFDERQPLYAGWADLRLEVGREDLEVTVSRLVALLTKAAPSLQS